MGEIDPAIAAERFESLIKVCQAVYLEAVERFGTTDLAIIVDLDGAERAVVRREDLVRRLRVPDGTGDIDWSETARVCSSPASEGAASGLGYWLVGFSTDGVWTLGVHVEKKSDGKPDRKKDSV